MTINLYLNNSPANYVDKSISLVTSLTGSLRSTSSIINPIINIEASAPTGFNYAEIPDFGRYYFVTGISSVNNGIVAVAMHVDVLMSYKTQIRASHAVIKRQESLNNRYLSDEYFKAYQNPKHKIIAFPNGFSDFSYILTLAGNGQTSP